MKDTDFKLKVTSVLHELNEVLQSINSSDIDLFVEMLYDMLQRTDGTNTNSPKIVGYSAGRMGLALRAFLMRLNHLGIKAYWLGDNYVPAMNKDDVFVCCSNSGTTASVVSYMQIFNKKANGRVVAFVGNKDSIIGKSATLPIVFKTCNGGLNSEDDPSKITSIQPMTTLTEQAMLLLFDIVALKLIERVGMNINDTKKYHSNIE
jgi:6-phospho-3-hexuloisomerase